MFYTIIFLVLYDEIGEDMLLAVRTKTSRSLRKYKSIAKVFVVNLRSKTAVSIDTLELQIIGEIFTCFES